MHLCSRLLAAHCPQCEGHARARALLVLNPAGSTSSARSGFGGSLAGGASTPAHASTERYSKHCARTACRGGGRFPRTPFAVPNKGSTARVHSVARTMSASSHTSPRPHVSTFRAWHQPWARNDCRPLGLARLCFNASRRVPAPSRRLILCASGKTGGWEPRGVPLAHVLPNIAPHAVSGDAPNMCVELRSESRIASERQRSPTRSR